MTLVLAEVDPLTCPEDVLLPAAAVLAAADAEGLRLPARAPQRQAALLHLDTTEENGHLADVELAVVPGRRRAGVGGALLRAALDIAAGDRRRTVLGFTEAGHADGRAFLRAQGFDDALVLRGSALDLTAVDRSLVAAWSAALDPAYEVTVHVDRLPDEVMPAFVAAHASMNDAPRDGLDVADRAPDPRMFRHWEEMTWALGGRRLTALAVHRDTGEGAGFSNVWWEPDLHTVVWQGGTGVGRGHRGHGLGRVVKARVLERLAELAPQATELRTDNAHTNPWMLRINDDLGFRPYGDLVEWQRSL